MSQASNSRSKDNGKKFNSFNLNQTFKGSKSENKSATGQGPRHGLQSLGKIGQSRRVLQPAILPSLKSENSGNDPRINLVPSGSQGWGNKKIAANGKISTSSSVGGSGTSSRTTAKPSDGQEISLRPNAGAPTKIQIPINNDAQDTPSSKPTWVNKVQPQQQTVPGSSVYFQKEFPKLVGEEEKDGSSRDQADEREQDLSRPGMGHPSMLNGGKVIDTPQGPMMMPPFPPNSGGDRQMFNGNQPYPYPYPMFQGPGGRNIPMPYPYPFPLQFGGKMPPFDPRFMPRMGKPPPGESPQISERPLTIKDSDLKALDDDKDDTGWAGAQEEVDYNAKLKFDESDDSDEDSPMKSSGDSRHCRDSKRDSTQQSRSNEKSNDETDGIKKEMPEGWPYGQGFPPQMQMAYAQQNWRMQFPPNYDPQRHPPPHGYPMHPMYFMPYGFPQGMPRHAMNEKAGEQAKAADSTTKDGHEDRKDIDKKADKQAKLREVEERMKKREEEGKMKKSSSDHSDVGRRRNDSEASDSARRSHSKDVPPRFQRQRSGQQDHPAHLEVDVTAAGHSSGPESPGQFRIMKRKDSLRSNESGTKDDVFKIPEVPSKTSDTSKEVTDINQRSSRASSSSSLYQETVKSDHRKKTDSQEKQSRSSSSSSIGKTDRKESRSDKKEGHERDRGLAVKELKDFSSSKERENREKHDNERKYSQHKEDRDHKSKTGDSETKSSKSLSKANKSKSQSGTDKDEKPTPETKGSPWATVVSGSKSSAKNEVSLKDIQKEELEEEIRKQKENIDNKRSKDSGQDDDNYKKSYGEGKFRSDNYYDNRNDNRNRNENRYNRDDKYNRSESRNDRGERQERLPRRGRFDDRGQERYKGGDDRRGGYDRRGGEDRRGDDRRGGDDRRDRRYKDEQYDERRGARGNKYDDKYVSNDSRKEKKNYDKKDTRQDVDKRDHNKRDGEFRRDNRRDLDHREKRYQGENDYHQDYAKHAEKKDLTTEEKNRKNEETFKEEDVTKKHDDKKNEKIESKPAENVTEKKEEGESVTNEKTDDNVAVTDAADKAKDSVPTETKSVEGDTVEKPTVSEDTITKKHERTKQDDFRKSNRRDNYRDKREDSRRDENRKDDNRREDRRDRKGEYKKGDGYKRDESSRKDDGSRRDERKSRRRNEGEKYDKDRTDYDGSSRRYPDKKTYDAGRRNKERSNRDEYKKDKPKHTKEFPTKDDENKNRLRDSKDPDVSQDNEKEEKRTSGGFGVPSQERKSEDYNKSDSYESRKYTREGRGRGGRRGSSSSRGPHQNSRSSGKRQGEFQSENRSKNVHKDGFYEDISPGEFSDASESKDHSKSKTSENRKQKSLENEIPPRFQGQGGVAGYRGRGRSASERGSRGRGRGRGRGGHQSTSSFEKSSSTKKEQSVDEKGDDDSESYYSAAEAASSSEEKPDGHNKPRKTERSPSSSKSYNAMKRGGYKPGRGGSSSAHNLKKSSSFLVNRQQAGNKRTSYKSDRSLPAAEKSDVKSVDVSKKSKEDLSAAGKNSQQQETTTYSSQKKVKQNVEKKEEKKRDITREFDLNNIASVVCVENITTNSEMQMNKSASDDDGFVTVTSKKQQKEEKRKLNSELKREAMAAHKAQKVTKVTPKPQNATKTKQVPFVDAPISSVVTEQIGVPTTSGPTSTATSTTVTAPASNAAMAAIGAWEPAQSLMRNAQVPNVETSKPSLVAPASSVNAWQRPLSLNTAPLSSLPDPRAVGTGKPSSSHAIMNKSSLPTPESASPLVTPTAPTPIGGSSSKVPTSITAAVLDTTTVTTEGKSENVPAKKVKTEDPTKTSVPENKVEKKSQDREQKRDSKTINKRQSRDRAPRFASNSSRKESSDYKYDESRKMSRSSKSSEGRSSKSTDRPQKRDSARSTTERKPEKRKTYDKFEKQPSEEIVNDNVFTNETVENIHTVAEVPRKSVLSDADKVVGSNKPSLKSQSSVGSYTAPNDIVSEETLVEVNIRDTFQAPEKAETQASEEELSAKDTARSVIKSLNDEEERSLETRSLPSTPPLAVKIPEPTLSGPSSDPGRAPSPSTTKTLPSLAQEENEMNRRLFYARKAWDETPTTWSNPSTAAATISGPDPVVSTIKEVQPKKEEVIVASSSTTTEKLIVTSTETLPKPTEEKTVGNFTTKRTEQQVCKVKPQQQVLPEENKTYQVSSQPASRDRQITSKFNSYVMQNERTGLYESSYNDPLRQQSNQTLNFHSLNQVRSLDSSSSPITRDYLLSHPGNVYPNNMPASQNQFWQVVSSPNAQTAKNSAYQTHSQASLFTAPGSLASSHLMLQYGSNFPPQRNTSSLPNQHVNVMQVTQQHQAQQGATAGRVVGMLSTPANPQQVRRDQQHYAGLQGTSEALLNNGAQMALLLDPSHITTQQRSDMNMMKHVHAKPFEPTSQTPPLMQSPPVIAQQSVLPHAQAQPIVPTVFSQTASSGTSHHMQNVNRFQTQPLLQQPPRQGNVQTVPHQNQLVAPVRPRSVQGHSLTVASPPTSMSAQEAAIFPYDPNIASSLAKSLGIKPAPRPTTHNTSALQHMQVSPMLNNQYLQLQQQTQRNLQNRALTVTLQNRAQSGPGPIQRPSHNQGTIPNQPATKVVYPTVSTQPTGNTDGDFRKSQRQKMLDDTKKYFQQDQQEKPMESSTDKPLTDEKPQTTNDLSKHDKIILPMKDKKYDYKKNQQRNLPLNDHYKRGSNRRTQRNDTSKSMKAGSDTQIAPSAKTTADVV